MTGRCFGWIAFERKFKWFLCCSLSVHTRYNPYHTACLVELSPWEWSKIRYNLVLSSQVPVPAPFSQHLGPLTLKAVQFCEVELSCCWCLAFLVHFWNTRWTLLFLFFPSFLFIYILTVNKGRVFLRACTGAERFMSNRCLLWWCVRREMQNACSSIPGDEAWIPSPKLQLEICLLGVEYWNSTADS